PALPEMTLRALTVVPPIVLPVVPVSRVTPGAFPSPVVPAASGPIELPSTVFDEPPVISTPLWLLPETRFPAAAVVPPVVVPLAAAPVLSGPMKFALTTFALVERPSIETPAFVFPEMTLRAAPDDPPTVLWFAAAEMTTPAPFARAETPLGPTPMKLPST